MERTTKTGNGPATATWQKKHNPPAGYFGCGMPYNRLGKGSRPLLVVQGLTFENKPQHPLINQMYQFLGKDYTVFSVLRKPRLPAGYTLADMAKDYADRIREEFGAAVDVIGISTGGSIAQYLAADHPDVVRRLVLHSSAHQLNDAARQMQLEVGYFARQRRWIQAYELLLREGIFSPHSVWKRPLRPLIWLAAWLMALSAPQDPSDLLVTIEAEDQLAFKNHLEKITALTLVIAGKEDPFYSETLFRETAQGIPNARLILYDRMGHPANGRQFERDVLAFLCE